MANKLVNTGLAIVTARLLGNHTAPNPAQGPPNWIGWGDGAGTTAITDSNLFFAGSTACTESRVEGTGSQVTTTSTNDTYQVTGTLTAAGAGRTITNAGLFDGTGYASFGAGAPPTGSNPTNGTLFVKGDFTGIALNVGDSISFTFRLAIAST